MADDKTIIRPRPGRPAGRPDSGDHTVVRPRPGGAASGAAAGGGAPDATVIRPRKRGARIPLVLREAPSFRPNTLSEAASTLLSLAPQLAQLQGAVDVDMLHQQAVQGVRRFDQRVAADFDSDTVRNARYLLCSLIDETVLNTHWGEHSAWSQKSLLRIFHNETYGGERVFEMIEEALGVVRKNYDFLELAYLCLALGFEGKYRIDPAGKVKLEKLRSDIYEILKEARDRFHKELSPAAAPASHVKGRLHSFLPVWVSAALTALLAFGVYMFLLFDLNENSDSVQAELASLIPAPEVPQFDPQRIRPELVRLREILAPEIEHGVVRVEDRSSHAAVVLRAEELFDSGSTSIHESFHPVLDKIAKALEIIPGRTIVAGHTDDRPIRTPRFPSNWHLSLARATAVAQYMAGAGDLPGRLVPEGRGDTEPVADNGTAEGRARNRRVTVELYYQGQ